MTEGFSNEGGAFIEDMEDRRWDRPIQQFLRGPSPLEASSAGLGWTEIALQRHITPAGDEKEDNIDSL